METERQFSNEELADRMQQTFNVTGDKFFRLAAERLRSLASRNVDNGRQEAERRDEVAYAEPGDPPWPEHFSCDFDTSAPQYAVNWKSPDRSHTKWLVALPNGKIIVGVAGYDQDCYTTTIDDLLKLPEQRRLSRQEG